jgi:putative ABC transport system ATP-binding protein
MFVLESRDLIKVFGKDESAVRALDRVSLQIHPGEFAVIMGPSGSGKSTLLNVLAGLDVPTSGQVLLEGSDLASMTDDQRTVIRRRRLGFVFQGFNLLPHLTAEENVAMPLVLDGLGKKDALARAGEALQSVGVWYRRGHVPGKLSGGEQQRVAIARALVFRPAVIFADEPTGNLDSVNGAEVIRQLQQLCREHRCTILFVTHDPEVAAQAGRILLMRDGHLVQDSVVEQLTLPGQ